jgi:hypothetical protein
MEKIYINSEFKCHTTNPEGTFREVETDFFDGKCEAFIMGYRFVPAGESWIRSDGQVFHGEMIAPWKDYAELDAAQRKYEREQIADMENALAILLGGDAV